jgi:hypothetical protein
MNDEDMVPFGDLKFQIRADKARVDFTKLMIKLLNEAKDSAERRAILSGLAATYGSGMVLCKPEGWSTQKAANAAAQAVYLSTIQYEDWPDNELLNLERQWK